jgi:hypothetical protein
MGVSFCDMLLMHYCCWLVIGTKFCCYYQEELGRGNGYWGQPLVHCFSNFHVYKVYLGILLNCSLVPQVGVGG